MRLMNNSYSNPSKVVFSVVRGDVSIDQYIGIEFLPYSGEWGYNDKKMISCFSDEIVSMCACICVCVFMCVRVLMVRVDTDTNSVSPHVKLQL